MDQLLSGFFIKLIIFSLVERATPTTAAGHGRQPQTDTETQTYSEPRSTEAGVNFTLSLLFHRLTPVLF